LNARAIAGVYELGEMLDNLGDSNNIRVRIESAVIGYVAEARAVTGLQKSIAYHALVSWLEKAGHTLKEEKLGKDNNTSALWKEIQESIWREDASLYAVITLDESNTVEWAWNQLNNQEASFEIRLKAKKVLWRDEFPGIHFDCPDECYRILCQNYGAMRYEVIAQFQAENPEATKEAEREAVKAALGGNIKALHNLPKHFVRAFIRFRSGVLKLLDGKPYSNTDPRAIAVKHFALRYANEINYFLRLQIDETNTPVEVCHKLLGQIGIRRDKESRPGAISEVSRPGKRGEKRDRIYSINPDFDPLRTRLLEALRQKFGSVSSVRKDLNLLIQAVDTHHSIPTKLNWGGLSLRDKVSVEEEPNYSTYSNSEDLQIPPVRLRLLA
jgi:hypothetical protein